MKTKAMTTNDTAAILSYFDRGSAGAYDLILVRSTNSNESIWSFPTADIHAAEKAAWMMRRLNVVDARHARRANLRIASREITEAVVVVTELPSKAQAIWRIGDRRQLLTPEYLQDECLKALTAGVRKATLKEHSVATASAVRRRRSLVERSSSLDISCSD